MEAEGRRAAHHCDTRVKVFATALWEELQARKAFDRLVQQLTPFGLQHEIVLRDLADFLNRAAALPVLFEVALQLLEGGNARLDLDKARHHLDVLIGHLAPLQIDDAH